MTDEKKRKRAAQAIQALLDIDGIKTTVKAVSEKIEGENLSNIVELKDKLANDMRATSDATTANDPATDRRRVIGDFVVANWDLIKDNEVVKSALLNSYCMGRYKKEQRDAMAQELLDRVGATVTVKVVPEKKTRGRAKKAEQTESVEKVDVAAVKTETEEPLDHRQYTF